MAELLLLLLLLLVLSEGLTGRIGWEALCAGQHEKGVTAAAATAAEAVSLHSLHTPKTLGCPQLLSLLLPKPRYKAIICSRPRQ